MSVIQAALCSPEHQLRSDTKHFALALNCSTMYRLHTKGEVAKSLGNQARGVQPACTMTTQNSKISSNALKSRLITYLST